MKHTKLAIPLVLWLSVFPAAMAHSQSESQKEVAVESSDQAEEPPSTLKCVIDSLCATPQALTAVQIGESRASEAERLERERIERERIETERIERERAEQERLATEAKRLAEEKAAKEAAKKAAARKDVEKTEPPKQYASVPSGSCYDIAFSMAEARWPGQGNSMKEIVRRESGCNPHAVNKSSGACGIPQALPCSKIPGGTSASVETQIEWMINYIAARYGTPSAAVSWHNAHNWY